MKVENIADIYQLSPMQQGILFHILYAPNSELYFLHLSCTIKGDLDVIAFEQAWQRVVERHAILRTSFHWQDLEKPLQIVNRQIQVPLKKLDWRLISPSVQQQQLEAFLLADRQQGFDLTKAPLMRLFLIQLTDDTYQFVWSKSHLILDGWSRALVLKEVLDIYDALRQGQDIYLAPSRTYGDYIEWLQQQDLSQAEAFWRQMLSDMEASTSLGVDRNHVSAGEETYAEQQVKLSAATTITLQTLARQNQLTLNTYLQGAWAVLLSRYSNQEDVVFGVTSAGRPLGLMEVDSMVGLFINTLPTRVRFGSMEYILPWLKQLQTQQAEVSQYEYTPLMQVQEWSNTPRSQPLFESILVFENYPVDASLQNWGGNLKIDDIQTFEKTNYPLTAIAVPGAELELKLLYDCRRFDAETISRMLGHWQTLLGGMIDQTKQTIAELPLLTATEQNQILHDWHSIPADYQPQHCIHQLFEAQVEKTPDAVALIYENQKLTYSQLNAQANQLAHHLQQLGVAAETLVGICCQRSLEMVIGILGILKAGGAYVPLDPAYPQERLTFIAQDAQLQVIVTEKHLGEKLAAPDIKLVYLDGDRELIAQNSTENPQSSVTPASLAYIIYTSGSTGKPKGVFTNHSNVVRLFAATQTWFEFQPQDVWTLFHSIAFDFSVWEIWGALLYGGRLIVVPYEVSRSPAAFSELLRTQQVTVLNQTPSAFRQLMYIGSDDKLSYLRLVIFGGEALDLPSLRPWFERYGDQHPQLVNMYGITETTVHVTYRRLQLADLSTAQGSAIGRPIRDLQVYVLDQHQQLLPIGVAGEMYVGGAGLARGYLNRPELTAQKFIVNPFAPQTRLYRSGDLARYLPNGDLEYLGRIDDQVKIRGFRIELSEIVAVLNQHPNVREAVVLAGSDATKNKRLVAYFVPKSQPAPTTSALQIWLKEKLPDYMVPSVFVSLPTLPLTTNGKVDRRALPAPNTFRPELDKAFVAPQSLEEQVLANIWAEALHLDSVGINDNFFELGGDSIRSIQVQSKAQEQGINFSLPELFQYQTIHELLRNIATIKRGIEVKQPVQPFSLISLSERSQLPDDIEDAYPLSKLQAGMLFESEFSQENTPYHNVTSLHLEASLDLEKLQTAIAQLTERHSILRTSFDLNNFSQPLQLVHPQVAIPLEVVDLRHLSPIKQQEELATWWEAEKRHKFDWTKAPLLRFYIHHRSEQTFEFSFTEHHAILDGWSVALMLTELFTDYISLLKQETPSAYFPRAIAFRDFITLEQQALASKECQQYWTEKLDNNTVTILPRWSAASGKSSLPKVCHQDVTISAELSLLVKQLAKSAGVPLKSVLLTAHLRVLNLLSGQTDIITGLVTNGRPEQKDGDRILGLFLNTLPLRLQLDGGTWMDLIQAVFQAERELLDFRWYPLAQLQQNFGGQPLFETVFNFVNFHIYQSLQEMEVELLEEKFLRETNFPLSADFSLDPFSSQVNLVLEYDAAEFSQEQIQAIGGYYTHALAAMVREPSARYELQSLLSTEEKQQLLVEWNQTANAEEIFKNACDICIHQLIENQVKQTPNAVAVVFENQQLTYHELNCRANQLAHYLQELGVKPEVLVGICVERSSKTLPEASLDMVVGILGILKAGGAYLPLDRSYPQERLAYMLADAQVSILLTQQQLISTLPPHTAKDVCLDTDRKIISERSQFNPQSAVTPQNLAYVIYTSGSTGQAKGVMIEHQSLVNAYLGWEQIYQLRSKASCHLQMASFAFDVFSGDVVRALCSGGKLVLCPKEVLLSPEQLYALMLQEKVDCAEFVPVVLRHLIAYLEESQQRLDFMQLLICGSDSWYGGEYEKFRWLCGEKTRLINSFGLTEATIDSSYFESPTANLPKEQLVPIGRPFPNTQIYIIDSNLQPVPIGVTGELYISGKGLARGYRHRPDLTTEKFIANPFNNQPEARLYKTGDLARYWADGNIEFLRRSDRQVKIRGFRIELGEIEALLSQHPTVREVVVLTREEKQSGTRLVAYVVPEKQFADRKSTKSDLRQFLKTKLPDYMIPALFVILEALPLTPNGKIDRGNLPEPDFHRELEVTFVAPGTPIEEMLALMWTEVLGVEQVGIHDNFFELGGHSLLAMQLVSRIRTTFNVELPLRNLFAAATIAELGECIQHWQQNKLTLSIPPLVPIPRNTDLPLSFAQQRLWFLEQLQEGSSAYNILDGLRLQGVLNVTALEQSLNEVIRRHESLRTTFTTVDGQPVQAIAPTLTLTILVLDLRHLPKTHREAEVMRVTEQEAQRPFNLAQGLLLRCILLQLDETEHVALLVMHHIISDAWSMGVLVRELAVLYEAFSRAQPSLRSRSVSQKDATRTPLPELPIQYADFAVWQHQWLQGQVLEAQLSYWKQQLGDNLPTLELPTDRIRPVVPTFTGRTRKLMLSQVLTTELEALSQREGVTLFMTLLAVFQILLRWYTNQDDIVVGTDVANRNHLETEELIGFFVNQLVLRTDLSFNPTFEELLQRVKKVTLGAYAHQDLPFNKLVEVLNPGRDLNRMPLFQVKIVLQNTPMPTLELSNLTLEPLAVDITTAQLDLLLNIVKTDQGLMAILEYSTDLFEAATISRMLEHFETILQEVVKQPKARLNTFGEILSAVDRQNQTAQEKNYRNTIQQKLTNIKQAKNLKL